MQTNVYRPPSLHQIQRAFRVYPWTREHQHRRFAKFLRAENGRTGETDYPRRVFPTAAKRAAVYARSRIKRHRSDRRAEPALLQRRAVGHARKVACSLVFMHWRV